MSDDVSDTSDTEAPIVESIGPKCATCGEPSCKWVTTGRGSGLLCAKCDDLPEKPKEKTRGESVDR